MPAPSSTPAPPTPPGRCAEWVREAGQLKCSAHHFAQVVSDFEAQVVAGTAREATAAATISDLEAAKAAGEAREVAGAAREAEGAAREEEAAFSIALHGEAMAQVWPTFCAEDMAHF